MGLEVIDLDPEIEDTPTKSLFEQRRCRCAWGKRLVDIALHARDVPCCHSGANVRVTERLNLRPVAAGETWTP